MSFVHLHTHSHYSLLDGLGTIPKLVSEAKRKKMPALALTDHGVMYGLIEFYQECIQHEIKPILGIEGYLTAGTMTERNKAERPYHLVLLAFNNQGYKNLLKLTSDAHLTGFYYKPRFNWDTLEQYHAGLIALTGCLQGPVSKPLLDGNREAAIENLKHLIHIFGISNVYLEVQHRPSIPEQSMVNSTYQELSETFNVPLVATNDIHYIHTEDAAAHDILICLQMKAQLTDKNRISYLGEDYSMLSATEMREHFAALPDAVENTLAIAERCNVDIELGKINLPTFTLPEGIQSDDYLRELCLRGLERRYHTPTSTLSSEVLGRLDYELEVIKNTGFADYFLIVQDFVNWAKSNSIMVGPGRGSAAGSLVSYLIGITNIDPLAYELLFERFLNPERISMPDIDMDFADTERNRVLTYVEEKYGTDHVSQIITFGTMASRAAVRDVGRVMGVSYNYCDRIAKLIPPFAPLKDAIMKVEELKTVYAEDEQATRLLDMAQKLEGIARHASTHACAVVITKDPLINHVPLQYSSSDPDVIISQYSMHPVEDLGLLKIDFLGLTNLTILQTAIEIIEKTAHTTVDLDALPLDDEATFHLLQHGDTIGIFQLESDGMTRYLKQLKPTNIEDIIAMVALYRPGPMQFIEDYIAGKHGKRKIQYVHPKLAPILNKTYGIAVYQEQILQIARELAGFTYGEADILRKAVGKKIRKLLVEQSEKMIQGMMKQGIDRSTAQKIWDFILPFARYGFNRSHAASYAIIAYHTAYLKAHFPAQFMAALMTADLSDTERVAKLVYECRKMGLSVLPPDVNDSFSIFTVVVDEATEKLTNNIRFGLMAIKNVGEHIAKAIIHERKQNGRYVSIEDFLLRISDKDLNKKSLESLIRCGALDAFGDRAQLLGNLDNLLAFHKKTRSQKNSGQEDLFADLPLASKFMKLTLDDTPVLSLLQKLAYEKELLGLYITSHPFEQYLGLIPGVSPLNTLDQATSDNGAVKVAGIITGVKKIVTREGKPMVFTTIEDSTASIELVVFPKLMEQTPEVWRENQFVLAHGQLTDKDGLPKILTNQAERLTPERLQQFRHTHHENGKLWIRLPKNFSIIDMEQLKRILLEHPGSTRVYIVLNNGTARKIKTQILVSVGTKLKERLARIVGSGQISVEP